MTLGEAINELTGQWKSSDKGIRMGSRHLAVIMFVDNMLLLARTAKEMESMLADLIVALRNLGLTLNGSKSQFTYGPSTQEMHTNTRALLGQDKSLTGMSILGRAIAGGNLDDTSLDVTRKIAKGWRSLP